MQEIYNIATFAINFRNTISNYSMRKFTTIALLTLMPLFAMTVLVGCSSDDGEQSQPHILLTNISWDYNERIGISNLFEFNGYLYDGVEGNEERHRQQMTLSFGYPLYPWYLETKEHLDREWPCYEGYNYSQSKPIFLIYRDFCCEYRNGWATYFESRFNYISGDAIITKLANNEGEERDSIYIRFTNFKMEIDWNKNPNMLYYTISGNLDRPDSIEFSQIPDDYFMCDKRQIVRHYGNTIDLNGVFAFHADSGLDYFGE